MAKKTNKTRFFFLHFSSRPFSFFFFKKTNKKIKKKTQKQTKQNNVQRPEESR